MDDRKNEKPQKIPWALKKNKKNLRQKFNPKKSHSEFPSHKNFQRALNDITRKIEILFLNSPKKTCHNFATPKNHEIEIPEITPLT